MPRAADLADEFQAVGAGRDPHRLRGSRTAVSAADPLTGATARRAHGAHIEAPINGQSTLAASGASSPRQVVAQCVDFGNATWGAAAPVVHGTVKTVGDMDLGANAGERKRRGPPRWASAGGVGIGGVVIAIIAQRSSASTLARRCEHGAARSARTTTRAQAPEGAPPTRWASSSRQGPGQHRGRLDGRSSAPTASVQHPRRSCSSTGGVRSACGMGQAAMGPFYCPGDQKLYIDLAFYRRPADGASTRRAISRRPT